MPRPRLHDDALRSRLLDVASTAISEGGADALRVREVAAAAGTSPSAVYALFGGRDELVKAVGDEAFRRFAAHLAGAPRSEDPDADLLALGVAYRTGALTDPHFYRVMFDAVRAGTQQLGRGPATEEPTFGVLRDAVARVLVHRGDVRAEAAPEVALRLWALVHGLVGLELAGLLPGGAGAREQRYRETLAASGAALFAAAPHGT